MQTWQLTEFSLDALHRLDAPPPEPRAGEVLVRWRAWSLNYRDVAIAEGNYFPNLRLPQVLVSDAAGDIVAVGPGVSAWQPGDRVFSQYLFDWEDGPATLEKTRASLGAPGPGLLAELVCVPERALVRLPPELSYADGATLPIAGVSAWNALFEAGALAPGDTVLIEGTGGVSIFALQLARAAGLRAIVTSSSEEKLQRARELGASATINYRALPAWSADVLRLTDGRGVDLVLDVGGAATLPEAIRSTRFGGRIALIGFLSGRAISIDALELIRSGVTLQSLRVGSRAMAQRLAAAFAQQRLHAVVDREFPFDAAPAAFRHLAKGTHFGKILIRRE